MRKRIYLNDGWKFSEVYEEKMCCPTFDESQMADVRLPHTCKELPFHYFDEEMYQMVSGYRKWLQAPEDWKGQRVILTFEGAAHESEVFLNGKKMCEHHCGYTAFSVDISDMLNYGGKNLLTVRVDSRESLNIPPFGFVIDYMTYGGIYRDVYIEVLNQNSLEDVFIKPRVRIDKNIDTWIESEVTIHGIDSIVCGMESDSLLRQWIRKKGESEYRFLGQKVVGQAKEILKFSGFRAELWDVESPVLYEVRTELFIDGEIQDALVVTTGFRKAEFRSDGFYLNGRKFKIRGLNRHQSYPYVGYAMPASIQRLDADILKNELGLNAVRTSHYPQSHDFLNRCDELGLLVFTEIPGWQHIGDESWKAQAIENVRDMVLQYRNHISIILWGVRINESEDDDLFYGRTNKVAHGLDDTRSTGGVRAIRKSSLLEDVYTYNDFVHDGKTRGCEKKEEITPDMSKPYLISEYNGHMYPTKAYDCEGKRTEHAIRHANVLDAVAGQPDIAGSFGWCMADYNTHKDFGSSDRVCYHGVLDMFRNPKQAAAVYASQQEKNPVLEISSSMDIGEHPESRWGDVYIFTNADSVRMYKNDRFVHEYKRSDSSWGHLSHGPILINDFIGDWDWGGTSTGFRFEAVKNQKIVKTVMKGPMKRVSLQVWANHYDLKEEHSYDVAAVRIQAVDENGNILNFYNEPVCFEIEGEGSLIGPDMIALQGGMGGTYVKSAGISGKILLKIHSGQAETVCVEFTVNI